MTTRLAVATLGVLAGVYGAVLLLQQGLPNLLATGTWLVGGVVAHDFLWAPVVVVGATVGARLVPPAARPWVTVALVVIATVTISAVPVLGRFGARDDNATLLDRDYVTGWLVFVLAVVVGTVAVAVVRTARGPATDSDADAGGQHLPSGPAQGP